VVTPLLWSVDRVTADVSDLSIASDGLEAYRFTDLAYGFEFPLKYKNMNERFRLTLWYKSHRKEQIEEGRNLRTLLCFHLQQPQQSQRSLIKNLASSFFQPNGNSLVFFFFLGGPFQRF